MSFQWIPPDLYPLIVLGVGVTIVLGLIAGLRINAFLALITAAMVVSLMSPGEPADKLRRVAVAFGNLTASIGIVIAAASIIGKCMLDSGAADRIVRSFVRLLGEKRSPLALVSSGYVLAVPVFFDTVFYLLVPLARSLYRRTRGNYLLYLLAISVGGALTHTLVPPTPGPLTMAATLRIDLGLMMLVGALVAAPAAVVGLYFSHWLDARMPVPMRQVGAEPDPEPLRDDQLPPLFLSLLPVLLPVVMISTNTIVTAMADSEHKAHFAQEDVTWESLVPVLAGQLDQNAQPDADSASQRVAQRIVQQLEQSRAWATVQPILADPGALNEEKEEQLRGALNEYVLPERGFYDEAAFAGVQLPEAGQRLLENRAAIKLVEVERLNRILIEATYPEWIEPHQWETPWRRAARYGDLFGDANLALMLAAAISMIMLKWKRRLSLGEMAVSVETALMSAGVIILITAGGGAFGRMLSVAGVGEAIENLFPKGTGASAGMLFLTLGFLLSMVLKVAQGSSTVAMITAAGMLTSLADPQILGFHQVYLATAIGGGSLVGSWMNDSGFWVFAKMGGLTEIESLKSWTPALCVIGTTAFLITALYAYIWPMAAHG